MTIAEAIAEAAAVLRVAGVAEPRREAGSLLMHVAERDRAFLLAHDADVLAPARLDALREAVRRRAAGEPLQYITGRQEFYGLDFEVNRDVLIPRPETELVVGRALRLLDGQAAPAFCDVGTGSGCIAVALLVGRADARACGLDISEAALGVAARNAARHGVADRLTLVASDGFAALGEGGAGGARFDLVVSNPPYVTEEDLAGLQREVREHEPRRALTPGGDGLSVIRRLLLDAPRHLRRGGHLVFEIGFGQSERVAALVDPRVWTLLDVEDDLQGIPRVFALRRARALDAGPVL